MRPFGRPSLLPSVWVSPVRSPAVRASGGPRAAAPAPFKIALRQLFENAVLQKNELRNLSLDCHEKAWRPSYKKFEYKKSKIANFSFSFGYPLYITREPLEASLVHTMVESRSAHRYSFFSGYFSKLLYDNFLKTLFCKKTHEPTISQ